MKRVILVILAVVALALGGTAVFAAVTDPTATCTTHPTVTQTTDGSKIRVTCTVPNPPASTVTATATVTVTQTLTATPAPSETPTPTDTGAPAPTDSTGTPTPGGDWACTITQLNDNCPGGRGYDAQAIIPMSNGFNTHVANQSVNPHGTVTVHANGPGDWEAIANLADCGGCVQTYNNVTQLTNNWNGSGWGDGGADDTPLDSLSTFKINYSETSPQSGASYEFAPDIWDDNYSGLNGPGSGDVMFWVDTKGRCNAGAFGPETLGHATIDGQTWTVHRWGSYGDEIIFVLDGPGGPGTCAQQSKGSINIKAGFDWLVAGGFVPAHPVLNQVNTGWEITQSSGATFTVHDYSITAGG